MGEQIEIRTNDKDRYKKLRELVKRTNTAKPAKEDVEALRRCFDEDPGFWRGAGDMARRALDHILRTYYSQSTYLQESINRRMAEMREELGYKESSPLERLLIEQILVCWVNLYILELNSASKLRESHSTEAGLYWDRRLTGAQTRFRRASESLARVRKLLYRKPALQFNIATSGGQQVNLAK